MTVIAGASETTTTKQEHETTEIPEAGELENYLRSLGIDLTQLQLGNIQSQTGFQDFLSQQATDLFSPEALSETETLAGQAGQITSEEEAMIAQMEKEALALGESDINRRTQEGLGFLKQEVGPSRGLRFGDTPILDRGGRIVGEGIRQQAQLGREIRGRGAEQRLRYPLERQRFQESLRENARRFRLGLAGTAGQLGLGLAGLGDPFAQQKLFLSERLAQPTTAGTSKERKTSYGLSAEGSPFKI